MVLNEDEIKLVFMDNIQNIQLQTIFRWGIYYAWKHHGAVIEGAAGMPIAAGEGFFHLHHHY